MHSTKNGVEYCGRRGITMDTSPVPLVLARQRLLAARFRWYSLREPARGSGGGFVYLRKQNQRGEEVCGLVPHITLKEQLVHQVLKEADRKNFARLFVVGFGIEPNALLMEQQIATTTAAYSV